MAYYRDKVLMEDLLDKVAKEAATDDAVTKIYDDAAKAQNAAPEIHARHILVPTEDEAKAALERIKAGEDFAKVADELSKDPGSKGGDLGWFTKDKMVPEFADAAFKLKPGEISDPVKTNSAGISSRSRRCARAQFPPLRPGEGSGRPLRRAEGAGRFDRQFAQACEDRAHRRAAAAGALPPPGTARRRALTKSERVLPLRARRRRLDEASAARSKSLARALLTLRNSLAWPNPSPFRRLRRKPFPTLPPIDGVRFATAAAGVRYKGRTDVMLALFDEGTRVAGVFTRSKCPSAPVDWCRARARRRQGPRAARQFRQRQRLHRQDRPSRRSFPPARRRRRRERPSEIFLASTGVIGEPLDAAKFDGGAR